VFHKSFFKPYLVVTESVFDFLPLRFGMEIAFISQYSWWHCRRIHRMNLSISSNERTLGNVWKQLNIKFARPIVNNGVLFSWQEMPLYVEGWAKNGLHA